MVLACFARQRLRAAVLCLIVFHLHLLCDLIGSRGPSAVDLWPIFYFGPFSKDPMWLWKGQWPLDAWPNPVFFAIAIWGFRGKRPIYLTATYPYTPATAPPVPADRPTQDMIARAARDRRFGVPVAGSLGSQLNWAPTWELHWLDFNVAGGRRVRIYHATNKTNPAARYTIYQDPDTGQWMGWEQGN